MSRGYEDLVPSFSQGSFADASLQDFDNFCQLYLPDEDGSSGGGGDATAVASRRSHQSFKKLKVSDWKGEDCQAWAAHVLHKLDADSYGVDLCHFGNLSGRQLLQYLREDFCLLVGEELGSVLYQEIQKLKSQQGQGTFSISPDEGSLSFYNDFEYFHDPHEWKDADDDLSCYLSGGALSPEEGRHDLGNPGAESYNAMSEGAAWGPEERRQDWDYPRGESYDPTPLDFDTLNLEGDLVSPIASFEEEEDPVAAPEDASDPLNAEELVLVVSDMLKKIKTSSRRNRLRGPKNWELLVRMLVDERTNPALIRWEDEASATFRLMKPEFITYLWCTRTESAPKKMIYNNFARGLRYHYKTGALRSVSERQMVYGLGPLGLRFLKDLQEKP